MQHPKISLQRAFHKGAEIIKLVFEKDDKILKQLRTLNHLRWSQTQKSWYVPYEKDVVNQVFNILKGKAYVDYSAIRNTDSANIQTQQKTGENQIVSQVSGLTHLTPENQKHIEGFRDWMRSRRYSESTIGTYCDALGVFLRYFSGKKAEDIDNNDLVQFNNQYILRYKLSSSYQNQVVNAVKLFFRTVVKRSMDVELIHRPKRAKLLPNVLSKEEIKLILTAYSNVKHKTMLSLIYSCGLRRSELLNLKLNDIDSKRGLVIIRQSKGRKDRIAPLSEKMLGILREYFIAHKPKEWLFEGQNGKGQYDERSLASVLKQGLEKSKISKPVTLHWLRHSYATHLLENGTDLRYIQEILGHSSSKTTEIYTHVSNKSIQKIVSPFDTL